MQKNITSMLITISLTEVFKFKQLVKTKKTVIRPSTIKVRFSFSPKLIVRKARISNILSVENRISNSLFLISNLEKGK